MSVPSTPPPGFLESCGAMGVALSEQKLELLSRYLDELLRVNELFNLTAVRQHDEAWTRHVLDSLSLVPHLKGVGSVIDVGSGGGLPGIPLAIVCEEVRVVLVEATGKKARFLKDAVESLGLRGVEVIHDRAESVGHIPQHRERYDAATGRAIGRLREMLEYTLPLVRVGGRVLAMKGRKTEQELREAGDALHLLGGGRVEVFDALQETESGAVIVEVWKERSTPGRYPRLPGTPRHDPL